LRPYEAAVIFDASLEDTIIRETTEQVVEFVRSHGGTTGRVDRWGRRTFAYELRHKTEGYYVFIELSAEPPLVAELDRMLTLSDDVLRHRVIRQPDSKVGRARPAAPARPSAAAPEVATPAVAAPEVTAPEATAPEAASEPAVAEPEVTASVVTEPAAEPAPVQASTPLSADGDQPAGVS
jgi:small subunit ribosomal protein S6